MQPRCSCTSEPWKFLGVLRCPALNSAGYSIICFSFRVKECPVPTNKELADDDPELLDLMEGGGLQVEIILCNERNWNIDHIHDFCLLSGIILEYSSSAWRRLS